MNGVQTFRSLQAWESVSSACSSHVTRISPLASATAALDHVGHSIENPCDELKNQIQRGPKESPEPLVSAGPTQSPAILRARPSDGEYSLHCSGAPGTREPDGLYVH